MRILVTGSAGHLGDGLVQELRRDGHDVIGLDVLPSPTTDLVASVTDRDAEIGMVFLSAQPDVEHHELLLCAGRTAPPGLLMLQQHLAGALNEGQLKLDTPIFCENGSYYYGGETLHDDEPNATLPVEEVLAKSSNIGFAKIALSFAKVTQDGDGEGALFMDRLPTKREASAIRICSGAKKLKRRCGLVGRNSSRCAQSPARYGISLFWLKMEQALSTPNFSGWLQRQQT